jgi:putative transposase
VIYLDGMQFGSQHVISAVGVDVHGSKHVLGIQLGATENSAAVKDLLIRLREQGLNTERRYLFVIDGAKALRAAIGEVCGANQLVQLCRTHKLHNVVERLPKHDPMLVNQTRSLRRAAWRLPQAEEDIARMKKLAEMIEREHPEAAASLREGLEETHHQPRRRAAEFTPLPSNHQRDRKSPSRSSKENRQRLPLA